MNSLRSFTITVATTGILALWSACIARADVLYNNLGGLSNGNDPISSFGPLADSFSTLALGFLFNDLKLLLSGDNTSDGSTSVRLLSDRAGNPGSILDILGTIDDSLLTSEQLMTAC
jgi:hypothetical protein